VSKVTSILQITLPKALADRLGMKPGDKIQWEVAGELVRVIPAVKKKRSTARDGLSLRLRSFDQATRRQKQRKKSRGSALLRTGKAERGWTREAVYLDDESVDANTFFTTYIRR
jgi:AbrB family looped-hinge helix DNA binding protein